MKIEDINEPLAYRYSRTRGSVTIKGEGVVIQKYQAANGWQVILHDKRNNRAPTLRPAHIVQRVRVAA